MAHKMLNEPEKVTFFTYSTLNSIYPQMQCCLQRSISESIDYMLKSVFSISHGFLFIFT